MRNMASSWYIVPALVICMAAAASGQLSPDFVRHNVEVPGAKVSYLLRQRSQPTLVLIPGSFNAASVFGEMIRRLNPNWTIMVVELRGHGGSWPPPVAGTIPQLAGDVLRAVEAAGIKRFYVGGHSIGGMVAIEIAGERPHALKGVISMEGWTHHSVEQAAFHGRKLETMSPAQLAEREKFRQEVISRWTPEQVKSFATIWRNWSGLEILRTTMVPILEIWGDRDMPSPSRKDLQIPGRPNIELVWIHGVGHSLPVQAPSQTAAAVNRFIAETEARGR